MLIGVLSYCVYLASREGIIRLKKSCDDQQSRELNVLTNVKIKRIYCAPNDKKGEREKKRNWCNVEMKALIHINMAMNLSPIFIQ